jgi:hypothetical protein
MKTSIMKKFTLFLFGILVLSSIVAALLSISLSTSTLEFTKLNQQKDLVITNNGDAATISITPSTPSVSDGTTTIGFSLSDNNFALAAGSSKTIMITSNGNPQNLKFGQYTSTLTITADDGVQTPATQTTTVKAVSSFCSAGPVGGNLTLSKVKIDNQDGKDDEWELLDTIEIEVEVDNDGNDDIDDVFIEIGLFNSNGNNIIDDMEHDHPDEEERDVGNIRDGKDEKATFVFRIPADVDDGGYRLAVKAYSDDLGETVECVDFSNDLNNDFYETVDIDRVSDEERFIVVDDILIDEQATCGEAVSGFFTVFNIGDEDQERVLISMKNAELGLDQKFEITQDLDQGDDDTLSFVFTVPNTVEDGIYNIEFRTEYDYNNGVYREISEDTFLGFLQVIGCKAGPGSTPTPTGKVLISASLSSDAKAGEELVVTTSITNIGTDTLTSLLNARTFQSWAELSSISPTSLSLAPGESKTSTFTFNVKSTASGTQSFIIESNSAGNIDVQEVEVNIAGGSAPVTGFAGFNLGGGSNLIWIIAIVNIILIILIIIVAVRLSQR